MKRLLLLIILTIIGGIVQAQYLPPFVKELVTADEKFSELAQKEGIAKAFLKEMHKDCILYTPNQVNGIAYFSERKKYDSYTKGTLSWKPVLVDIANCHTLGVTSGPYSYRNIKNGDTTISTGEYLSIWYKPKNKWKLLLNVGVGHKENPNEQQLTYVDAITFGATVSSFEFVASDQQKQSLNLLKATDELYGNSLTKSPSISVYNEFLAGDVMLLRENELPIKGKKAAINYLNNRYERVNYFQDYAYLALSRDLGYTLGSATVQLKGGDTFEQRKYIHIWRKGYDGVWRIIIDVEIPSINL